MAPDAVAARFIHEVRSGLDGASTPTEQRPWADAASSAARLALLGEAFPRVSGIASLDRVGRARFIDELAALLRTVPGRAGEAEALDRIRTQDPAEIASTRAFLEALERETGLALDAKRLLRRLASTARGPWCVAGRVKSVEYREKPDRVIVRCQNAESWHYFEGPHYKRQFLDAFIRQNRALSARTKRAFEKGVARTHRIWDLRNAVASVSIDPKEPDRVSIIHQPGGPGAIVSYFYPDQPYLS
jgi:hypothetical protein